MSTDLRARIVAMMRADDSSNWIEGRNPMRDHVIADAARKLLPLMLAEMDRLNTKHASTPSGGSEAK